MENEFITEKQLLMGDANYIPVIYQAIYDKAIELTNREIENGNIDQDGWLECVDSHRKYMMVMHSDICSINNCECNDFDGEE